MTFYEIDGALQEAIEAGDKPVRVRVDIDRGGHFEAVFEQDIVEADFYALKETTGGTSARGDVLLENPQGIYSASSNGQGAGKEVRVYFSLGEGLPYFRRFVFYVDDNGFQDIRGPGRKRYVRFGLRDFSAKLRKTDESRDWTAPAIFTYVVICDKTQPEKSLVHLIAQRAGLSATDIDCSTIPLTLPYCRLKKNIWVELSDLAKTYRAHLECAPEKPLVFAHSPYQGEPLPVEDFSYTFTGDSLFYLRKTARADQYRNTVRLKINLPVALEKQEIWRYEDPPVLYDDNLIPHYFFRTITPREIERDGYEAYYRIKDSNGKEHSVVYASDIDSKEEAESRLGYDGGPFAYSAYDVSTHTNKALLKISHDDDGDLFHASVYGKPIILDLNRSCFLRDTFAIEQYGTCALNVTGSYFTADEADGRPQYEDWTMRELAERLQEKREITVKTHRGLFHARVGARVKVATTAETITGIISGLSLRYRRAAAFEARFGIREE
jgi:hypothetical protein